MSKKDIPALLCKAVLFAREYGNRLPSGKPFSSDKWHCQLSDKVHVTYDGHPDSDEDGDNETYVVAVFINFEHMTFFVDVEGCLGTSPSADIEYVRERFQEDLESESKGVTLTQKKAIEFIETSLKELNL